MLLLVKIWQVCSCGQFMQHLETSLLIAEADRVLWHLVMFLTVFFYWMYKMKYSCYQDSSVIHGWFVYCAFGWEMHRLSKSLEIRFRIASISKMRLLTCPCSRRKRVEKYQAILTSLDGLQEQPLDSTCQLVNLRNYCLWCFFFGFLKSSVVYAVSLCTRQWSDLQ